MESRFEPVLRFVGEQDGAPERELKRQLVPLLAARPLLTRAYLARIAFDSTASSSVALVIRADAVDLELVKSVGELVHSIFRNGAFLDILFITEIQEAELAKVCAAFYDRRRVASF